MINIFDMMGPVMVGPSSSHTAGAARIGNMGRTLLGEEVARADIGLYGSFAETGYGHGTDRALLAGLLGMKPDDLRIPNAYEEANRTGAAVYEIKATERTEGTLGFWWCGRYGMHKWAMPIQPVDIDLSAYRHVTICSPIWVFALAAPVRSFCQAAAGQIRAADYILVHHQGDAYENAAEEMDRLLGVTHTALRSIQCREGVYKERGRRK